MNQDRIADFAQVAAMAALRGRSIAATQGACHNFTIEWLSHMFESGGATTDSKAKDRMTKLARNNGAGNPILQKVFGDRWKEGGNSYKIADQMMISIRGLKDAALAFDYRKFIVDDLLANITSPDYSGMIYSFWFKGSVSGASGGAHTIGFFRSVKPHHGKMVAEDEYVSGFDPNFGEYRILETEFKGWFTEFMKSYGGIFTHHMLKSVSKP